MFGLFWDYTTCMRLLMRSVSSGLVSLFAVVFCLLASMVVHGFRSVLLSAFSFAVHLSVVMLYNTYLIRKTHQRKSNKKEGEEIMIKREDYQLPPKEGFILITCFIKRLLMTGSPPLQTTSKIDELSRSMYLPAPLPEHSPCSNHLLAKYRSFLIPIPLMKLTTSLP